MKINKKVIALGGGVVLVIAIALVFGQGELFKGYLSMKNFQFKSQGNLSRDISLKDDQSAVAPIIPQEQAEVIVSTQPELNLAPPQIQIDDQNNVIAPQTETTPIVPEIAQLPSANDLNQIETDKLNLNNEVVVSTQSDFVPSEPEINIEDQNNTFIQTETKPVLPEPEPSPEPSKNEIKQFVPENFLLKNELIETTPVNLHAKMSCYLDDALKIGTFQPDSLINGIDPRVLKQEGYNNSEDCQKHAKELGYRYSEFYATTAEFALVCTSPCNVHDQEFLWAAFEGQKKGVTALKEAVGYLPKQKMEFHIGQDRDCFEEEYGKHPAGYTKVLPDYALNVLCSSEYWWYLEHQKNPKVITDHDLEYVKSLASQVLTIHEPIHVIFSDYNNTGKEISLGIDNYNVAESFCKGLSLFATGIIDSFGHTMMAGWDKYSLTTPPPASDVAGIANFLVYSLNKRFGFEYGKQTREFFDLYKNDKTKYYQPVDRIKALLDKVLKTDTSASFQDIGISTLVKRVKYIPTRYFQTK